MADIASVRRAFSALPNQLDSTSIKNLERVILQFELVGEGGGLYHVVVENGDCHVREGRHPSPDLTFTMPADDYAKAIDLLSGHLAMMRRNSKTDWFADATSETPVLVRDGECRATGPDESVASDVLHTHGPGKGQPV